MNRYLISSRHGRIKSISIHKYKISSELRKKSREQIVKELKSNPSISLYDYKGNYFFTFMQLDQSMSQYPFINTETVEPPFNNTSVVSNYLGKLLRNRYVGKFPQYLNQNIFVVDQLKFGLFHLLKCFQFNIEVFRDGDFLIHLLPVSKVVNSADITADYLDKLKAGNENCSDIERMEFRIRDSKSLVAEKFDLLDENYVDKANKFLENKKQIIATFDYRFVSNYSVKIFTEITKRTNKELKSSISLLAPISGLIEFPESIELHDKPFYEINIDHVGNENNLVIGNDKKVKEQKAAFHFGIYRPVADKVIQPIVIGKINLNLFRELVMKFNRGGAIQIPDIVALSSTDALNVSIFTELKNKYRDKLLLAIFTEYNLPDNYFDGISNLKIRRQIYKGLPNEFRLSNFVVKCLEKLGGALDIIANTLEPESTYFVGIDLGHSTRNEKIHSNLCVVFFDNKGQLISRKVIREIPMNEALNVSALAQAMSSFDEIIKRKGLAQPQKLIIHRDGRIHKQDIQAFDVVVKKILKIDNYDIVEIIKSGYPIIAAHDGKSYQNLETGNAWMLLDRRYAILVTNIQAGHKGAVLSPIILKHRIGETNFMNLVKQVYWFTKVYTNNLFNSTRLPATTEKAHLLVGTSDKRFISTYLA